MSVPAAASDLLFCYKITNVSALFFGGEKTEEKCFLLPAANRLPDLGLGKVGRLQVKECLCNDER